jgi:molecular chaperone GrpE
METPATETLDPTAAEQTPSAAEAAAAEPAPEVVQAPDPLVTALAEVEKWKDMAYRNAAELDNFRKRMARETQEVRAYANAEILQDLFPILDSFEMGLEAARAESESSMIFIGMSMVARQLQDFLKDNGVKDLNPVGQAFDPNLHEAVSQEPSSECAEGTVLRVMRKGYQLKERLLRPATVVVSSGPPSA